MMDMLGNELAAGDSVHVKIGNEWLVANVVKVQNGGIAVTGIPKRPNDPVGVTMDMLVIQSIIGFNQQPPGSKHMMVLKLDTTKQTQGIIESAIKM